MRVLKPTGAGGLLVFVTLGVTAGADGIEIQVAGRHVTTFHYGKQWPKPFLHPLKTPSGVVVSRGFPLEKIPGESEDHVWHRGIWYGGEISGEDFWREKMDGTTGRLEVRGQPNWRDGRLEFVTEMTAGGGRALGSIEQVYEFALAGSSFVVDARITLRADRGTPLKMEDSEECCFGVRLADEFREDRGARLTNSEGLSGARQMWGKPARWVDYSAERGGKMAGVAVLDHPSNPRHPTRWHARNYGLNSANPVGLRQFTRDKSQDGSLVVSAGESVTFRYRVVIHDGDAAGAQLEKLYAGFAR